MITGGDADQALLFGFCIIFLILFYEFESVSLACKERSFTAEQIVVVGGTEVQQEIHMETALQTLVGLAPFGNHRRVREFLVKKCADILPEPDRTLSVFVAFHERTRHIDAESVAAHAKPETHDVLERGNCPLRAGSVCCLLPLFRWVRLVIAVIQCRLMGKEIYRAASVPL